MTKTNSTWLCALIVASGKISACDITPENLENFDAFVSMQSRERLIALEDALEFAGDAMGKIGGTEAIKLTFTIGGMWEKVRDLVFDTTEINLIVSALMK